MKLLKTRTFHFRRTCANFSRNSWSSFLLFSSLSSSRLSQASSEARKLLSAAFWWETNVSNALPIFVKVSVVDSLRFFVAGLKNGLLASVVFYAKEHKKSLNAEVKVENKSCGRLFEPILISILLYKSIHLGSKIIKKLLEITDSAGGDMKHFLGSLPDPPISESFQSSPVKHSPLFVWGNLPAVLLLLPSLVPPLKEGNSSFGSSFSIFSWSSSSLSASVIIFEEFTTTFGLVHGFLKRNSSTSSKNAGLFFGVSFPVFSHSSL